MLLGVFAEGKVWNEIKIIISLSRSQNTKLTEPLLPLALRYQLRSQLREEFVDLVRFAGQIGNNKIQLQYRLLQLVHSWKKRSAN